LFPTINGYLIIAHMSNVTSKLIDVILEWFPATFGLGVWLQSLFGSCKELDSIGARNGIEMRPSVAVGSRR